MTIDEIWAVSLTRATAFFAAQSDVVATDDGFRYKNCFISLADATTSSTAPLKVPRTQLIFSGPDDDVHTIHQRFFLRFLSAGG